MWMERIADFLQYHELDFSTDSIRRWLVALQQGAEARCKGPLSPGSMDHVHRILRAFCGWSVKEEPAPTHLMKRIPPAINRDDRIEPFTEEEVERLLTAARKSRNAARDVAILAVLLDAGLRVSELCDLRMHDLDMLGGKLEVRNGLAGVRASRIPGAAASVSASAHPHTSNDSVPLVKDAFIVPGPSPP